MGNRSAIRLQRPSRSELKRALVEVGVDDERLYEDRDGRVRAVIAMLVGYRRDRRYGATVRAHFSPDRELQ